jgi:DNA-binding CsgD family transcriptional regulator
VFKRDSYIKLVDTRGDFRFGYIAETRERGSILVIDLYDEGLSKINWDNEYAHTGNSDILIKDFNLLLTPTEKKMIPFLACNMTTNDVAAEMGISPVTVRAHIRDLKIKCQLQTREQLFAYSQGIMRKLNGDKNGG